MMVIQVVNLIAMQTLVIFVKVPLCFLTKRKANVISYDKSHGTLAKDLSTVSGSLVYDHLITASTMDNNLLSAMQI